MANYIDSLVALYAENEIAEIEADGSLLESKFGRPIAELAKDKTFTAAKSFVEDIKRRIEKRIETSDIADERGQVEFCLKALLNVAMFDKSQATQLELKMDTMRALLVAIFGSGNWSGPQKTHFDLVYSYIKGWNSFFLSYTNGGAKAVNHAFEKVIDLYVDNDVQANRDRSKDNLLADAIINRLQKDNLTRSFYDKSNIGVGDHLCDEIKAACEKTFAFIQLVQRETFSAVGNVNWSFEEYQVFLKANQKQLAGNGAYKNVFRKRFKPMIASRSPENVLPAALPYDYETWSKRVLQEQHFKEVPSDPEGFEKAVHDLACKIVHLKYQIIENVPA